MLTADAAAWVQAIGSVLAIFVAVIVAAWQNHSERAFQQALRKQHTRAYACAIQAELLMSAQIVRMRQKMLSAAAAVDADSNQIIDLTQSIPIGAHKVFDSAASSIGLFDGKLAAQVVLIYRLLGNLPAVSNGTIKKLSISYSHPNGLVATLERNIGELLFQLEQVTNPESVRSLEDIEAEIERGHGDLVKL